MRTTHLPRALATVAVLITAGACSDNFSPSPTRSGVADMTLVPRTATIRAGQVVALTAQVFDEFGEPIVGAKYTWTSSDESVATVSSGGTVFGHGEGRAAITASAQGQAQTSAVRVLRREPKLAPPGPIL
jgi:uncharacterized protein YjdB